MDQLLETLGPGLPDEGVALRAEHDCLPTALKAANGRLMQISRTFTFNVRDKIDDTNWVRRRRVALAQVQAFTRRRLAARPSTSRYPERRRLVFLVSMTRPVQHNLLLDAADDLQWRARELTEYWIGRAREITGASPRRLPVPEVRFDLRGRAAGQAVFARRTRRCHIRLNGTLLAAHPKEMLEQTVPHEVAHVAIYRLYGRHARPHGAEWKALMQAFGVDASSCHALPAQPTRRLKRYRYACGCDEPAWLTSIRHKRAQAGTRYVCRVCGAGLEYAGA